MMIRATEESKTWDLPRLRILARAAGATIGKIGGAFFGTHDLIEIDDGYESEAMCCAAFLEALRDKLNDEFPREAA